MRGSTGSCREASRSRKRQLFPQLEAHPDLNRGEVRLAGEVMLEVLRGGEALPRSVTERAISTLKAMACG